MRMNYPMRIMKLKLRHGPKSLLGGDMKIRCRGNPYCIEYDEWEDLPQGYDKQCLFYYSEDRVLCEDDDSIVDEEEELSRS